MIELRWVVKKTDGAFKSETLQYRRAEKTIPTSEYGMTVTVIPATEWQDVPVVNED